MKAWMLNGIGDITYQDVEMLVLKENEVRIKVMAAGICGSDIPRIYETGAHVMPIVPGHEFSGIVEGIGKEVSSYWMGKRVAVFPKIPCGKCRQCRNELYDMCTDYDYIGSRRNGAFAEYVDVPMDNILELPESVDFEVAAMMEPMAVAANAIRMGYRGVNCVLALDCPVAVCGLGTIGLMVVMFLKEAGYQKIYIIGNKDAQKKTAKVLGISEKHFCDSTQEDAVAWLKEISNGGVYAYYECVGSNESINYGIQASAPGGWIILVGNPRSDMTFSRDIYWKILRNQMTLYGKWNSSFRQMDSMYSGNNPDDWHYVLRRLEDKKIDSKKLITHRFPLSELDKGFSVIRDKVEDYTKVLMISDKG